VAIADSDHVSSQGAGGAWTESDRKPTVPCRLITLLSFRGMSCMPIFGIRFLYVDETRERRIMTTTEYEVTDWELAAG
jgi:hypothetical protein